MGTFTISVYTSVNAPTPSRSKLVTPATSKPNKPIEKKQYAPCPYLPDQPLISRLLPHFTIINITVVYTPAARGGLHGFRMYYGDFHRAAQQ